MFLKRKAWALERLDKGNCYEKVDIELGTRETIVKDLGGDH